MELILASQSPRRQELLGRLGIPFRTHPADLDEVVDETLSPCEQVKSLARQKAQAVAKLYPHDAVIGSDTMVFLGRTHMGKPGSARQAADMLRALSGTTHEAITGVCMISPLGRELFSHTTRITFEELDEELIRWYVSTGEWRGCAGGYQIQNGAMAFTREIVGTQSGTMGFPLNLIRPILLKWGFSPENSK